MEIDDNFFNTQLMKAHSVVSRTWKRDCSLFLTRMSDAAVTRICSENAGLIRDYFGKLCGILDDFDSRLQSYVSTKEDQYIKTFAEFTEKKRKEIERLRSLLDAVINVQEREDSLSAIVKRLTQEKQELMRRVEAQLDSVKSLERAVRELREDNAGIERDAEELKRQVKRHMSHCESMKLAVSEICKIIAKTLNDPSSTRESLGDTMREVYSSLQRIGEVTYASLIESCGKPPARNMHELFPPAAEAKRHRLNKSGTADASSGKTPTEAERLRNNELRAARQENVALRKRLQSGERPKRSEYEQLFIDCVEATKRLIYQRRLKCGVRNYLNPKFVTPQVRTEVSREVKRSLSKLEECCGKTRVPLSPEDKLNVVTLLVCNEKVLMHVYQLLFPSPDPAVADCEAGYATLKHVDILQLRETSEETNPTQKRTTKLGRYSRLRVQPGRNIEEEELRGGHSVFAGESATTPQRPRRRVRDLNRAVGRSAVLLLESVGGV